MSNLEIIILTIFICLFDWLGGSYWKPARRYGIPTIVFLSYPPDLVLALQMLLLVAILSLDFDAIETRNWGAVWCKGIAISFCFFPVCSYYGMLIANVWVGLTWWSNTRFLGFKWKWQVVELLRLSPISVCIFLQRSYPIT